MCHQHTREPKWEPRTRDLKACSNSRAVNSVENDTEECIEPAAD